MLERKFGCVYYQICRFLTFLNIYKNVIEQCYLKTKKLIWKSFLNTMFKHPKLIIVTQSILPNFFFFLAIQFSVFKH